MAGIGRRSRWTEKERETSDAPVFFREREADKKKKMQREEGDEAWCERGKDLLEK